MGLRLRTAGDEMVERGQTGDGVGVVLIHGSELGAWVWEPVVAALRHRALAVDLPGRGGRPGDRRRLSLDDAVRSVAADVRAWTEGPVVLVGHSFAGVLLPGVVQELAAQVRGLVWLGATVPEAGRSWCDLLPGPQRLLLRSLYRVRPAGMRSPRKDSLRLLCSDLDAVTAAAVVDRRVPEAPRFLLDPVPSDRLPARLPSHYVRLLEDRTVTDGARQASIDRLPGVHVHDLAAGHLPMISQPEGLADLLDGVARASTSP